MWQLISYAEPNGLLRGLRQHDLAGLRCPKHAGPPVVTASKNGLTVEVCCNLLGEVVREVLGTE